MDCQPISFIHLRDSILTSKVKCLPVIFLIMRSLWLGRNKVKHNGARLSPNLIWCRILSQLQVIEGLDEPVLGWNRFIWRRPIAPFLKRNTDATFLTLTEWSAVGWIARNSEARQARGVRCMALSPLMAETWAVLNVLEWAEGWDRVWIESDSLLGQALEVKSERGEL